MDGRSAALTTEGPDRWVPARLRYDLASHPFPELVAAVLGTPDLTRLGAGDSVPVRRRSTDQRTRWHERFYESFPAWQTAFARFVREVVAPVMPTDFHVQAVPTLRVHLPGNLAVGEFHTDRHYGHPDGEVTFWLPLTPAHGTGTFLVESAPGRGDHRPVDADPGELIAFDAGNLEHGNVLNTTGATRVSFDFRCLPVGRPWSPGRRTVNSGIELRPGAYYAADPVAASAGADR